MMNTESDLSAHIQPVQSRSMQYTKAKQQKKDETRRVEEATSSALNM